VNIFPRPAYLAVIAAAVLLPAAAWCGDEDSKPAYMIYIDPETGKYTHEDPDTATQVVAPAAKQAPTDSQPGSPLLIVAGGVLAALLVVGLVKHKHKRKQAM
jgi:hypothetical protein